MAPISPNLSFVKKGNEVSVEKISAAESSGSRPSTNQRGASGAGLCGAGGRGSGTDGGRFMGRGSTNVDKYVTQLCGRCQVYGLKL